jgi:zinc transport system substrate-binding protein
MAVAFVTGCGEDAAPADEGVIAAFYPLAYAAEQVGAADVVNLTPAGAEPHELELTARDVERVRDASLVVYLGAGFQPAVEDAVERRAGPSLDVLSAPGIRLTSDARGTRDPHVWLDPVRFASITHSIAEALGDASAADELVQRLDALDQEFREGLARCRSRQIVTSHAAFGYLADRYDLEQIALVGVTPEAEPSPRQVARLVREIRDSGATTVFAETLVSPELAETIAREAGATTAVLDPLEGLAAAEADAGADYFSVMRDNLAALRLALDCT